MVREPRADAWPSGGGSGFCSAREADGRFGSSATADHHVTPDHFPDPGVFDITKPAPEHPQLTFGSGIHYCLGASLARAELQEALPLLAQRMPNLRIDGHVTWKPDGVGIFGPASMPITFDPGH